MLYVGVLKEVSVLRFNPQKLCNSKLMQLLPKVINFVSYHLVR